YQLAWRLSVLRLVPVLHRHRVLHPVRRQARDREQLLERACRYAGMDPDLAPAGAYLRATAQARGLGPQPRALRSGHALSMDRDGPGCFRGRFTSAAAVALSFAAPARFR